jgi:hypothetical protein
VAQVEKQLPSQFEALNSKAQYTKEKKITYKYLINFDAKILNKTVANQIQPYRKKNVYHIERD